MDSFVLLPGARRQIAALRLDERAALKVALGLLVAGYEGEEPRFAPELDVRPPPRAGARGEARLTGRIRLTFRVFELRGGGRQLVVEAIAPDS